MGVNRVQNASSQTLVLDFLNSKEILNCFCMWPQAHMYTDIIDESFRSYAAITLELKRKRHRLECIASVLCCLFNSIFFYKSQKIV